MFPAQIQRRCNPGAERARIVARRTRAAEQERLGYGDAAGDPRLRSAIAAYVVASRGVDCSPQRIIVVTGAHVRRMRNLYAQRQALLFALARKHLAGMIELAPTDSGMQVAAAGRRADWLRGGTVVAKPDAARRAVASSKISPFSRRYRCANSRVTALRCAMVSPCPEIIRWILREDNRTMRTIDDLCRVVNNDHYPRNSPSCGAWIPELRLCHAPFLYS